jgi:hypothetical protein
MLLIGGLSIARAEAPAAAQGAPANPERRIALVIGNGAYPSAPLKNPINDARAMAAALRTLGFEVMARENASQKDMNRAVSEFDQRLAGGGVGLFYYAGHGVQVRGRNYLIPVDAEISSENSVRNESIDVDQILDVISSGKNALNLVILDACRNNPFERRFRAGAVGGLAQVEAPKGALIAYATAPGKVAADGDGANGLYTAELLRAIEQPGLRVEDVFKRVRARVAALTDDLQIPWEASSLVGDFYFRGRGDTAFEAAFWQSIEGSRDPEDFRAYLEKYPGGQFATQADTQLRALGGTPAADAPRPVASVPAETTPPPAVAAPIQQAMATPTRSDVDGIWDVSIYSCVRYANFTFRNLKVVAGRGQGRNPDTQSRWDLTFRLVTPNQVEITGPVVSSEGYPGRIEARGVLQDGVFQGTTDHPVRKTFCYFRAVQR